VFLVARPAFVVKLRRHVHGYGNCDVYWYILAAFLHLRAREDVIGHPEKILRLNRFIRRSLDPNPPTEPFRAGGFLRPFTFLLPTKCWTALSSFQAFHFPL